jgi:hypothetical protein
MEEPPMQKTAAAAVRVRTCAVLLVPGVLLAACAWGPERGARELPAPSPQLVGSAALDLPGDCQPEPGVVYRTTYTVQPDGQVSGIASAPGARCVQDALGSWVSTFRYRPGEVPVPQALDWMFVTASRGR